MSRTESGLRLTATLTETFPQFCQVVENGDTYAGKAVTVSAKVRANNDVHFGTLSAPSGYMPVAGDGQWRIMAVTTVGVGTSEQRVGFMFAPTQNYPVGAWAEVEWIKLEEGPVATPWTVPEPAAELARCRRYCRAWEATEAGRTLGTAVAVSATSARMVLDTGGMRVAPAVTALGAGKLRLWDGAEFAVSAASRAGATPDALEIVLTSAGLTVGRSYLVQSAAAMRMLADAEV